MYHQLIPEFVGGTARLHDRFLASALRNGVDPNEAAVIFDDLPVALKNAPAFLDRMSNRWRYDFGTPLELHESSQALFGTHQFPEVEHLVRATTGLYDRLGHSNLIRYIQRLADPAKHQAVLFEARPLFWLAEATIATFEVSGRGVGNRTIDWVFSRSGRPDVLLEVKYRLRDVIDHIQPMAPYLDRKDSEIPWAPGDPQILFRDTHEKFQHHDPEEQLQGAWIHANIKVRAEDLERHFTDLPTRKLHFALLSTWDKEAYLLTRPTVDRSEIERLFDINPSDNFVVK